MNQIDPLLINKLKSFSLLFSSSHLSSLVIIFLILNYRKLQQNKETLELENERLEHLISQNEARNKPAPVNVFKLSFIFYFGEYLFILVDVHLGSAC